MATSIQFDVNGERFSCHGKQVEMTCHISLFLSLDELLSHALVYSFPLLYLYLYLFSLLSYLISLITLSNRPSSLSVFN